MNRYAKQDPMNAPRPSGDEVPSLIAKPAK
jgi:hypothetical protein